MYPEQHQTIRRNLTEALLRAGLPDIRDLTGRTYIFTRAGGSHFQALVGTVVAVQYSDEGGLQLHGTNPEIWSRPIISFVHFEGQDWATSHDDHEEEAMRKLKQLPDDGSEKTERKAEQITSEMISDRFMHGTLEIL